MSNIARTFGLLVASLMAIVSAYYFVKTGDWVAGVFCLGSIGYAVFFMTRGRNG
jgi:hypothetical protein